MTKFVARLGLVLLAMVFASSAAMAAGITIGTALTGNCYPFMCNDSGVASGQSIEYQQVYSSTAFSAPLNINSLTFFQQEALHFGGTTTVLSGNVAIYLSTTSAAVGALDSTLANNIGLDNTLFGNFVGGQSSTPSFALNGTSFAYNPANGNLLMTVFTYNQPTLSNFSGNGYLDAGSDPATSRAYIIGSGAVANSVDGIGLVTEFNGSAWSTPEPSSVALMALGLIGLVAMTYGSRNAANLA